MDVSENSGFSPQIIHFNKVFHHRIINHPFWGTSILGNTHMVEFDKDDHNYLDMNYSELPRELTYPLPR